MKCKKLVCGCMVFMLIFGMCACGKKGCKYSTEAGKRIRKYVRQEVYLEGVVNMPFLQVNVEQEIQKQRENDPEFKKIWDESRAEYRLIGEMISLRKKKKITQKELALLTGNKQQVISRIERKESIPTIRAFSRILDALGYELQIVKKKSV